MLTNTSQKSHQWFSWLIISFAAIGGILYGYDLGIIAGAILFIRHSIPMTDAQSSLLVAAVLGGGAIATLTTGTLAEWFGRKKMIIVAAIIFLLGVFSLAFAHSYSTVLIGRLTQGIGVGIVTIIIPLYLAESLPPEVRGRGISAFQLFLTFGILFASLIGLYFTPTGNWRGAFLSAALPGFILLIGGLFLPSSPRWLFHRGHHRQALGVLCKSRPTHHAKRELKTMRQVVKPNSNRFSSFAKSLANKQYLLPVLVVMSVAILQQLMGINSLLQFSAYFLKNSGLNSNIAAMLGSTAITSVNFAITILAFFLIDRTGRRLLLIIGTLGSAASLFFLAGVYFSIPASSLKGYLLLGGVIDFIISNAIGPGVVIWLVIAELLPAKIRSAGMSIALCLNSLTSTIFAASFLPLVNSIGYNGVFLICACAASCYSLIAYRFVPETKNKTLEEIELNFKSQVNAAETEPAPIKAAYD